MKCNNNERPRRFASAFLYTSSPDIRQQSGAGVELPHRLDIGGSEMSGLKQLEQQVLQLSPEDLAKFRTWFIELDHQLWDKQIEADAAAEKLDRLIAEARAEFKAGKAREM